MLYLLCAIVAGCLWVYLYRRLAVKDFLLINDLIDPNVLITTSRQCAAVHDWPKLLKMFEAVNESFLLLAAKRALTKAAEGPGALYGSLSTSKAKAAEKLALITASGAWYGRWARFIVGLSAPLIVGARVFPDRLTVGIPLLCCAALVLFTEILARRSVTRMIEHYGAADKHLDTLGEIFMGAVPERFRQAEVRAAANAALPR